jgi:putative intracellular protease/amidase
MGRNAEAIWESFQCVTGHDKTKIFPAFGCQIQVPLPDGSRQICNAFLHVSDSRYGCLGRTTRRTLAAIKSSSIVAFRCRKQSRFQRGLQTKSPIRDIQGLILTPEISIAEAPEFDVLLVPRGFGQQQSTNDEGVLSLIRNQFSAGRLVF